MNKGKSIFILILLSVVWSTRIEAQITKGSSIGADVIKRVVVEDYQNVRGGLANSYLQFTKNKKGVVAFMGGSITEMNGWREMVCQYLTDRFPDTRFEFIHAGISSTGSTPGAFRLENDVLSTGRIDLLFEEAAVNDRDLGETTCIRGMEGIVRHTLNTNRFADILMMHFADPWKIEGYNEGGVPLAIEAHEKVAVHYNLSSLNLAKEVTDRINSGEFTWEGDFKDLHPSPFGQELYFRSIRSMLERCWDLTEAQRNKEARKLPVQMDRYSYTNGIYADIRKARIGDGWHLDEKWRPTDGAITRKGYVDVPMLISDRPGSVATYEFKGTAIGICVVAGPDAGIVEYSIDGSEFRPKDLYTEWSDRLHLNLYVVLEDMLTPAKHELRIRISDAKNEKSLGHACRIVHFLVNKPT